MRPKTFSALDFISSALAALFLLFLFIYPHIKLNAMRDDIVPLCDAVVEAVEAGDFEEALARGEEIRARFLEDETMFRLIFDHEDVDSALDAIETLLLMIRQQDGPEAAIETENVRSIVTFLAGIETLTFMNIF
ncbi:MAG TPA: DUF4363 family protein [Clostridia bacterium]|nr:MAG: hypothetical protein BWY35_01633 [Firmicutes bacterium ADurb.Bin248]HOG00503.1 DUF4363 family protein [Clostridia bacterium]HOS17955.1 DUF4363 family protein [Clostridia bacterium]HPK14828.1 DUF4363 family protein [Clostridia bacterium]